MYIQAQSTTVSKSLGDSTALGNHLPLTIREPFSTYHWRTILPLTIREPFSTHHWRTILHMMQLIGGSFEEPVCQRFPRLAWATKVSQP